jgi:predicted RNA-binding protein with PIN domain
MRKYIIDGNNLIGKIRSLQKLQNSDKQSAREKLAFLVESYFREKKAKVSLHFDGFQNIPIKMASARVIYSENKTADDRIKSEISAFKNPKLITVVTSDNNLKEFARVCSATVLSSEEFAAELSRRNDKDEEEQRIRAMNSVEEFKKIFNVKK